MYDRDLDADDTTRRRSVGMFLSATGAGYLMLLTALLGPAAPGLVLGLAALSAWLVVACDAPIPFGASVPVRILSALGLVALVFPAILLLEIGVLGVVSIQAGGMLVLGGLRIRRGHPGGVGAVGIAGVILLIGTVIMMVIFATARFRVGPVVIMFVPGPIYAIHVVATVLALSGWICARSIRSLRWKEYAAYRRLRVAAWFGRAGRVSTLLAQGTPPNAGTEFEEPPALAFAAARGQMAAAAALLSAGASPDVRFRWRGRVWTTPEFARQRGRPAVANHIEAWSASESTRTA